jgi:hypothetical protein
LSGTARGYKDLQQRAGEETITSDLTYDLRSGEPDFIDKLVVLRREHISASSAALKTPGQFWGEAM